jgi:hypothetical protein
LSYQPVSLADLSTKLLTVETARQRTAITEDLSEFPFSTDTAEITFDYPLGWVEEIGGRDVDGLTVTPVTASLHGQTFNLTKDAALAAASEVHIPKTYTLLTPGPMITEHVNWWYGHSDKHLKLLAGPNAGVAFTRDTIKPYSNHALIDAVLDSIGKKFGTGAVEDVRIDGKFHHDLKDTTVRFIVPSFSKFIKSARHSAEIPDHWCLGVSMRQAITGLVPLEFHGYLYSYWCSNGATTEHVSSGKYRRKPTAPVTDAYDWAREVVDDVLGGLEHELDRVQALTQIPLVGELNDTLGQMFKQFRVPAGLGKSVVNNLVESDDLTAYGLMNAITAAANDDDVSPPNVESLLRAGGRVADAMASRCDSCNRIGSA